MSSQYIIVASSLFLVRGGVPDYTHNFANQLYRKGKLKYVATPYGRKGESDYDIRKIDVEILRGSYPLDKFNIGSKIGTLLHYLNYYYKSFQVLRSIKKENATVIFPEYYIDKFDILIYAARMLGVKYIILFHGLDIIMAKRGKFIHLERNIKKSQSLVFNSKATEGLYDKMIGISKPSMILYPGIDVPDVEKKYLTNSINHVFRENVNDVIFSTVAYLGKRKGIDKAIRIVHKLYKTRPNVKYYIGGVGEEREALVRLVDELDAAGYIFFLGKIDDETKYSLLRQSDIFMLPNYSVNNSDFEGFGISFIEASLCETVVVGGNHGGATEAVKNKETGYLLDFDKEEAIEECVQIIDMCLNNKEELNRIKNTGVRYVRDNYDWTELINDFLEKQSQHT